MPTVAIVADTHVPSREPAVPEWVRERVRTADHVVHAGDFDADETLATFEDVPADLTAVHGNMDPDLGLPSVATLDVAGVRFVVTHGTGAPQDWDDRVVATAREHQGDGTTVAVGGHIHQVVDREHDGMRLLNPGSATGADPAVEATMLTAEVDGDGVDVTVHRS
jgi:putative phosphoesterase